MVQTTPANDLTLHDVKVKFSLTQVEDEQYFREWVEELPEVKEEEKRSLDQVKTHYLYLSEYPMTEEAVKMVVLSPLLSLASFYSPPFRITAETPVQISVKDKDEIVHGRIDVLVIQNQFWVLVIEAKQADFSLKPAIPKALAYMMASPNLEKPAFGLVTNGSNFRFLKLTKQETPQYALSDEFTLNRKNDLYTVLSVLKKIGTVILN